MQFAEVEQAGHDRRVRRVGGQGGVGPVAVALEVRRRHPRGPRSLHVGTPGVADEHDLRGVESGLVEQVAVDARVRLARPGALGQPRLDDAGQDVEVDRLGNEV